MRRTALLIVLFIPGLGGSGSLADEYFVARRGSDTASGDSVSTAFLTVGKGLSVLKPGDTLTVMPGEYFESNSVRLAGRPDAPITIRAWRPGTVLLRGDVDAGGFQKLAGTNYTYVLDFDRDVEGVAEKDACRSYAFVPSVPEVEEVRASCYYDAAARLLYVHTSDSGPADSHALSISITNGFGLLIQPPPGEKTVHDVVIEGLAASGYRNREIATNPGSNTRWGFYIVEAERCAIRRCTAFFNGGGIALVRPRDCLIEYCQAFGNYSTFNSSGGNIICWSPATNTIQRHNVVHTTKSNGIRFYGDGTQDCALEGNLAYDCDYGEIWIKGGANATSRMVNNVSLGALFNSGGVAQENIHNNLFSSASEVTDKESNIWCSSIQRFDFDRNFVDPVNHDYRLQSDAPLRGKGPGGSDPGPFPFQADVFFVSPTGDDSASGACVREAWRTLAKAAKSAQPGETVYLLSGAYHESLEPAQSGTAQRPIVFKRRGRDKVVLDGRGELEIGIRLNQRDHIHVEGLSITGFTSQGLLADRGAGLAVSDCLVVRNGEGMALAGAEGFSITRCLFRNNSTVGLRLLDCRATGGELAGNVFDRNSGAALSVDQPTAVGLWSNYNNFVPGANLNLAGKQALNLAAWQQATGFDPNSLAVQPAYRNAAAGDFSLRDGSLLAGRGPLATNIGPYKRDARPVPLPIAGATVHSVTATTANIEWWTPTQEATTTLEWGATPACDNKIENIRDGTIFHTASLCGLKPGTKYYYRLSASAPATEFQINTHLDRLESGKTSQPAQSEPAGFETLPEDAPGRTFHVAVDGDDRRDGLTTETAWRSLRHAAAQVRAGDTVLIHAGAYEEHVPVRATGDAQAPITFRAAPGEKVWLDGSGQKRPCAIRLAYKSHVRLDGLSLRNLRASSYQNAAEVGAIQVIGGAHNAVSRCFYDGRAKTYMPYFIQGSETSNLLVENCVIINGWNGSAFSHCADLTIRHCVYYNCLIQSLHFYNNADARVTLSHNIFCDNIPQKHRNPVGWIRNIEALRADHNCYFMRPAVDEKVLFSYARVHGELEPAELKLGDLRSRFGQDTNSVFANPDLPVVKELPLTYATDADYHRLEMHRTGDARDPLDFADFMAAASGPAGKAADGQPIGLDPKAFDGRAAEAK